MTYEEFKGELYRIMMQQDAVVGRKIMLLEKGYTTRDDQMLNLIRYINRVTYGREDNVMHGDFIQVVWGEGSVRSMMSWDVRTYFERYKKEGWQGIIPELLLKIQHSGLSAEWLNLEEEGYGRAREKLILRPINFDHNRFELEDCIYWKKGDIALTLYGVVYDAEDDYVTMKIKRAICSGWGLSDEELLQDAMENTMRLMPPRLYLSTDLRAKHPWTEGEFLPDEAAGSGKERGEAGEGIPWAIHPGNEMEGTLGYRLTTTRVLNGAIAFFYPGVRGRLAEMFGDFYVGFTSIHEAVLHPVRFQSPWCMRESILGINAAFPKEEMLSGRIYRCRASKEQWEEV